MSTPPTSGVSSPRPPASAADRLRDFWARVSEGRHIDDLWSQFAADAREGAEAVQQCIHQRARMDSCARVNHHAGRLVDGDHIVIFIKDGERDVFWRGAKWRWVGWLDLDGVCCAYAL